MGKDLVISSNRHETKVAILEDEQLVELYFQRADEYSLVGSIHKGRVTRVLPGMQSAFVNIGLDRDAFLYVSDFFEESDEYEALPVVDGKSSRSERRGRGGRSSRGGRGTRGSRAGREERSGEPEIEEKTAPAPMGKEQEAEGDREQKSRRSRRRRGRSRGLPESKYASDAGAEERTGRDSRTERRESRPEREPRLSLEKEVADEPAGDFILLPGETLAKYGAQAAQARGASGADDPEIAAASAADEEPEEVEELEAAGDIEEPERSGSGAADQKESADGDGDENETGEDDTESAGEDVEDEPGEEPQSEDSEIAEMILGPLADSSEDETGEEREAADTGEDGTESSEKDAEISRAVEGTEQASAEVRDQDQRYNMQRTSRRGRRRGRGSKTDSRSSRREPRQTGEAESKEADGNGDQNGGSGKSERNGRGEGSERKGRSGGRADRTPPPSISDLLNEGQEILVQIAKEPLGQKGARITSHIALPGRYAVYMPTLDHLGVSRKIASDEERQRLRTVLQKNIEGRPGGFIMRTAGEGQSEENIVADMDFLTNLWTDIREKAEKRPAPALLHHDLQVVERILRDQVSDDFSSIWVDNEEAYEGILQFLQRFQPALVKQVRMYTRPAPIFDAFNITQELEKALRPKVWLKSGGYIVINQTEALVAIDINTGKYVGKSNRLEDTIVKTNIEAVKEISRQMRLRDLGGIIVVDFIDMDERRNRQKVMQAMEEAMRADRAPSKVLQFNDFGLVAITRKRVKQSLERTLCMPCPYCEGGAYVKSVDTVIGEILTEAHKLARAVEGEDVILRVHPEVAKVLKNSSNEYLVEIEEILGCAVLVTADPLLHIEKFDLA